MDETPPAARPRAPLRLVIRAILVGLGAASTLGLASPATAAPGSKKAGPAKPAKHASAKGNGKGDGAGTKTGKASVAQATSTVAPAAPAAPAAPSEAISVALKIERITLDNGLRVVLNPDHTSPTIAVAVAYDVGSRNEPHGQSGFAHLFEHMMFQGSRNVEKGGHFKLISAHGGQMNGTTNPDRTN